MANILMSSSASAPMFLSLRTSYFTTVLLCDLLSASSGQVCSPSLGEPRSSLHSSPTPRLQEGCLRHRKGAAHAHEQVPVVGLLGHAGRQHPVLCGPDPLGRLPEVVHSFLKDGFFVAGHALDFLPRSPAPAATCGYDKLGRDAVRIGEGAPPSMTRDAP